MIRAGFGIFYGGLESVGANPNMGSNYPFQFLDNFNPPDCASNNCPSSGITLENGFSEALAQGIQNFISIPGFTGIDSKIKTPYTMGYNLTVERSVGKNMGASIGYVGNVARHLGAYGVMGASMGGLMAMYTAVRLPHIFGHVLSQSGAFLPEDAPESLLKTLFHRKNKLPLDIWMDVGRFDFLLQQNCSFHTFLENHQYAHGYHEYAGGHNYPSWRDDAWRGLEYLFGV